MKKHLVIGMSFFTVSFSRFAPSREKASCGETVVQNGVFGECVSSVPLSFSGVVRANLKGQGCENGGFGKRGFCPLPKTGGFDEKWRK